MKNKELHKKTHQEEQAQEIEIQYILDEESQETIKKLQKKTFNKLISRDLEIIRKHKIKNKK